ncbi:hypothetical protein LRS14_26465 [Aquincola sp. J276]|nr:hypothetical protein [Aquincola sp. J276]MCR5868653.1 hypothetical protein [Aquincola sp. J276]
MTASQVQLPPPGVLMLMQATDLLPSVRTAHCTAPRLLGSGPALVDTMLRDSKHSCTAQAEAMTTAPSCSYSRALTRISTTLPLPTSASTPRSFTSRAPAWAATSGFHLSSSTR